MIPKGAPYSIFYTFESITLLELNTMRETTNTYCTSQWHIYEAHGNKNKRDYLDRVTQDDCSDHMQGTLSRHETEPPRNLTCAHLDLLAWLTRLRLCGASACSVLLQS